MSREKSKMRVGDLEILPWLDWTNVLLKIVRRVNNMEMLRLPIMHLEVILQLKVSIMEKVDIIYP